MVGQLPTCLHGSSCNCRHCPAGFHKGPSMCFEYTQVFLVLFMDRTDWREKKKAIFPITILMARYARALNLNGKNIYIYYLLSSLKMKTRTRKSGLFVVAKIRILLKPMLWPTRSHPKRRRSYEVVAYAKRNSF